MAGHGRGLSPPHKPSPPAHKPPPPAPKAAPPLARAALPQPKAASLPARAAPHQTGPPRHRPAPPLHQVPPPQVARDGRYRVSDAAHAAAGRGAASGRENAGGGHAGRAPPRGVGVIMVSMSMGKANIGARLRLVVAMDTPGKVMAWPTARSMLLRATLWREKQARISLC
nr:transcription initiation factor TFIID subunit 4-like [Aegilops tauschii subsp. strangulata]